MEYRFYLNDIEIDEPLGFIDLEISMNRDDTYHGMQFEVSTGPLEFFGNAFTYLKEQKELYGIAANVTFIAQSRCDSDLEYEEVISGRLNFGKYKDKCGVLRCTVSIPFEEEGCKVIFKNRFDQKVDLDNTIAFDKASVLPAYAQLGQTISIPGKALDVRGEGYVAAGGDTDGIDDTELFSGYVHIRPVYLDEKFNSLDTGQISDVASSFSINQAFGSLPPSPQILFEDNVACFSGEANYNIRLKGTFTIDGNNDFLWAKLRWLEWFPAEADDTLGPNATVIQEFDIFPPTGPGGHGLPNGASYDQTFTGSIALKFGYGYYAVLEIAVLPGDFTIHNTFDPETYFLVATVKACPPTDSQYYLVHEALSRIAESITNKCLRVKSSYYGRIDSQPFAFDADGCGALRMLTSGLKLRQAPDGKFFASAKELIGGLNAIDNIGFDITDDPDIPTRSILRIEQIDEFYQDQELLFLEHVSNASSEVQESLHYANIKVGYKKWEVQKVNGLNEFNSNREYRTNIETISTTLDITSNLIAGSYPIEITRQQSFASSGAADTSYDNEAFIICLERNAYDFTVEQGKVLNDANIFDPPTIMNFRLTPLRNLMRWFKSIINTYVNINSSANKLFFNAGTGNFLAAGLLDDSSACRLEAGTLTENQDLWISNFANSVNATPLIKNETVTFDYPLSIAEYNILKANPYGYIAYTCGNEAEVIKGFIKEVKFRPARGMANFTLRKKW